MNTYLNQIAQLYIVASVFLLLFLIWRTQVMEKEFRKNKCHHVLTEIKFEADPIGDETYLLKFCKNGQVLHSERFTEGDIYSDPNHPYKAFVKWLESEE